MTGLAQAFARWLERRRLRKNCLHHDPGGNPANTHRAWSWIEQQLIETGKRKMLWCTNCKRTWFV